MRAFVLTVSVMSMALPAAAQTSDSGFGDLASLLDRRRHERNARQYPP